MAYRHPAYRERIFVTTDAITTAARPPVPAESFTRLVQELVDLDYARIDNGEVGTTTSARTAAPSWASSVTRRRTART